MQKLLFENEPMLLEALIRSASRLIERIKNGSICSNDETLVNSICSAIEIILSAMTNSCTLENQWPLISRLEEGGVLSKLLQWVAIGHSAWNQHYMRSMFRMAIKALSTIHELAFKFGNERVMFVWFQSIHDGKLLCLLLDTPYHKETPTDLRPLMSKLAVDIMITMTECTSAGCDPLMCEVLDLLESIAIDTYRTLAPFYKLSTPQLDGEILIQILQFLKYSLCLIAYRDKRPKSKTVKQKSKTFGTKEKFPISTKAMIQAEFFITLTWALIHHSESISSVAMSCFREISLPSNSFCLSQKEVIRLLDKGYVHVLMIVREVIRGKCELDNNITLVTIDDALLFIIESLVKLLRDNGWPNLYLLSLIQVDNSSETINVLFLEGLFLIYLERRRQEYESSEWKFWDLFQVSRPWDDPQEMYLLSKHIIRMSNLIGSTKSEPVRHPRLLKLLSSNQIELHIELLCADKICPILIRCPPIDMLVESAPLLGAKVGI